MTTVEPGPAGGDPVPGSGPGSVVDAAVAAVHAASQAAPRGGSDAGGWAMAADALAFLGHLVTGSDISQIVEFGSGESTSTLAAAVGPSGHVTSIDNDPDAVAATRSALSRSGLDARVRVVFAPLAVRRVDGRHLPVYLFDRAELPAPAGLVVVDGPPSKLGGREGALRQGLALAGPGTIVVVDDADRAEESEVFAAVAGRHGDGLVVVDVPGFVRGLAVAVVTAPIEVIFGPDDPAGAQTRRDQGGPPR